jgi:tetratricopeptide (TPR) repeat protein
MIDLTADVQGWIRFFNLVEWWLNDLSTDERQLIYDNFWTKHGGTVSQVIIHEDFSVDIEDVQVPETMANYLIEGSPRSSGSPARFLENIAASSYVKDLSFSRRVFEKAEELALKADDVLDLHFLYMHGLNRNYIERDRVEDALDKAIEYCEKQIALAPRAVEAFKVEFSQNEVPGHTGFTQLAIIRDKQKRYAEAIELCKEALRQGWDGDWEKRIERYEKKLTKAKK